MTSKAYFKIVKIKVGRQILMEKCITNMKNNTYLIQTPKYPTGCNLVDTCYLENARLFFFVLERFLA